MKWVSGEGVIPAWQKNKKKQTKKTHQKKPVTDHTNSVTFLSMRWVLGEGVIPGSHQLGYTSLDEEGFR